MEATKDFSKDIGRRVMFNKAPGTVLYSGHLQHKFDNPKINGNDHWLGVEWDDPSKGKHNGTVEGFEYFKCKEGLNAGSLILAKKAEWGIEIIEALIRRYFKNHEVNEILKHQDNIIDYLHERLEVMSLKRNTSKNSNHSSVSKSDSHSKSTQDAHPAPVAESQSKQVQTQPTQANSKVDKEKNMDDDDMFEEEDEMSEVKKKGKEGRKEAVEKLKEKIGDRDCYTTDKPETEYDEEAIIHTFKSRFKRIEFMGFDKVWERIYQLDRILELGLNDLLVSDFGRLGALSKIIPNIRIFSLENNLFKNWSQVLILGSELRHLEMLSLSYNHMEVDPEGYDTTQLASYNQAKEIFSKAPEFVLFPCLLKIVAIDANLTFKKLNHIVKHTPFVNELVLCMNKCNDFSEIKFEYYQNIETLNLQRNEIENEMPFGLLSNLSKLKNLCLDGNRINRYQDSEKFLALEALNLSHNNVIDGNIITDLRRCVKLESLRIAHNPIDEGTEKKDIRRRAIAEIGTLKRINGMDFNKHERKDCEYYFLRWVFHEYFRLFNVDQCNYKYPLFEVWATEHYPTVFVLIKKYENPYPEITNEITKDAISLEKLKQVHLTQNIIKIYFTPMSGPFLGKPSTIKSYPKSTDFLYIRNFISQMFKLKTKELIVMKFKNPQSKQFETIDDMQKTIEFYDIMDNAEIIVEEQE